MECLDRNTTACAGPVGVYASRSGLTRAARCERHQSEKEARMDALEARLDRDYPGWRTPEAPDYGPADFDPGYAGEEW